MSASSNAVRAAALRSLIRVGMALIPSRRTALVYGRPDTEENALLVALALSRRYAGQVVLLCQEARVAEDALRIASRAFGGHPQRIRLVERTVPTAIHLLVRAELVLFTLPIYVSPRTSGRRLHVNIWHGTGPKQSSGHGYRVRVGADALAANSEVWGRTTAEQLGMPRSSRLVTGNPRQDMLLLTQDRERALTALGLDPSRPIAVWMPTFRASVATGIGTMHDGERLSSSSSAIGPRALVTAAADAGVQLVVKPHPLEADSFDALGLEVVTNDDIRSAEITLHQFLGMSDALITDYSSVWTDFAMLRRSVGLLCPDLDDYERRRGLAKPGLTEIAGALLLRDDRALAEFFETVATGAVFRAADLEATLATLQAVSGGDRTERLLDDVADLAEELHPTARFGLQRRPPA